MVEGGGPVERVVQSPVFGAVTVDSAPNAPDGLSLLRGALERGVGPVAVPEPGDPEEDAGAVMREFGEDLLEQMPDLVSGTDALQHENDMLVVANTALEHGVRSVTEFMEWMSTQESLARKSGMWSDAAGPAPVDPMIVQLARYLRMARAVGRNLEVGGRQRF